MEWKWIEWKARAKCASSEAMAIKPEHKHTHTLSECIGDEINHKNVCIVHITCWNGSVHIQQCVVFFSVEFVRRAIPTIG